MNRICVAPIFLQLLPDMTEADPNRQFEALQTVFYHSHNHKNVKNSLNNLQDL